MPRVADRAGALSEPPRVREAEGLAPVPDGLVRDGDAAVREEVSLLEKQLVSGSVGARLSSRDPSTPVRIRTSLDKRHERATRFHRRYRGGFSIRFSPYRSEDRNGANGDHRTFFATGSASKEGRVGQWSSTSSWSRHSALLR